MLLIPLPPLGLLAPHVPPPLVAVTMTFEVIPQFTRWVTKTKLLTTVLQLASRGHQPHTSLTTSFASEGSQTSPSEEGRGIAVLGRWRQEDEFKVILGYIMSWD